MLANYKNSFAIIFGAFASPFVWFIEEYIWNDWQFLIPFTILIIIDTISSIIKHWKNHTINSKGFSQLFIKVIVYAMFLMVIHSLTTYKTNGEVDGIFGWLDSFAYAALMGREALSIFENIGAIYPGIVPKWIMKRLKSFDENGPIKDSDDE